MKGEHGMLVVASNKVNKKQRIYHRCSCIYAKRIKWDNLMEMSDKKAKKRQYHECSYCAGLQGDVNIHKNIFKTWERKKNMKFIYHKKSDTLYIQTTIGFWKVFMKEENGKYLLYHRNVYSNGMDFTEAIHGEFHRQLDVKVTESLDDIVEYIVAHDNAKIIIMNDYRKLPRNSKKQKQYYETAQRKDRRRAARRLDAIFASLEKTQEGLKKYSFC